MKHFIVYAEKSGLISRHHHERPAKNAFSKAFLRLQGERMGVFWLGPKGSIDLTTYSPASAIEWIDYPKFLRDVGT